jgi:hypothetical protein
MSVANLNLQAISRAITKQYGDKGSCIMGFNLLLDGQQVVLQPAQGSSTCEFVYGVLKNIMVDAGIDKSRITIDYGVMD